MDAPAQPTGATLITILILTSRGSDGHTRASCAHTKVRAIKSQPKQTADLKKRDPKGLVCVCVSVCLCICVCTCVCKSVSEKEEGVTTSFF